MTAPIDVSFPHGLGDCVYFSHSLAVYKRHGAKIRVRANLEKQFLFEAADIERCGESAPKVGWIHGENIDSLTRETHWRANKAFANFSLAPMPNIGAMTSDLWQEFSEVQLSLEPLVRKESWDEVDRYFERLRRPIVLLHTKGNAFQAAKSVPDELAVAIYREVLERIPGTVLLLDWDNRVPRIAHGRLKHLTDDWKRIGVQELVAAIYRADLLIGIDSGPLHLCRFTDTPSVGLWFNRHHPALYSLPRAQQVNVSIKKAMHNANRMTRWYYNIVEEQTNSITAATVARTAEQLLQDSRYLGNKQRGRDVMLRHWIEDWTRAGVSSYGTFIDRNVSFDIALRHLARYPSPRVVETGCIRCKEDWRGAGYSTYLFGAAVTALSGEMTTVDLNEKNCSFAASETQDFCAHLKIKCGDSVSFLESQKKSVHLLYLDSHDTYQPGFAEHGLREIQASESILGKDTMIVYDDTYIQAGKWRGKGSLGVPWLLQRGWKPIHSSHQTVLVHPNA